MRVGREFNLFISNEDINIIQIIKSSEESGDGVTETAKHQIKKQEGRCLRVL